MILGLGTDIIEIQRVADTWRRKGQRFLDRVYTPLEQQHCLRGGPVAQKERLAVRFAAKEAVMKALGTGWRQGVRWRDIEIRHRPTGQPYVVLSGTSLKIAQTMGISEFHVTLTHSRDYASATVIAVGGSEGRSLIGEALDCCPDACS